MEKASHKLAVNISGGRIPIHQADLSMVDLSVLMKGCGVKTIKDTYALQESGIS